MEANEVEFTNTHLEVETVFAFEVKEIVMPEQTTPVKALTLQLTNPRRATGHFVFQSADEHLKYAITDKQEVVRLIALLESLKDQL